MGSNLSGAMLEIRAHATYQAFRDAADKSGVTVEEKWSELNDIDQDIWRGMAEYVRACELNVIANEQARAKYRR